MSSGRKASLRLRRRSSGQITLPVTTPHATKLKTMLTKKQICARISNPPTSRLYRFCNHLQTGDAPTGQVSAKSRGKAIERWLRQYLWIGRRPSDLQVGVC